MNIARLSLLLSLLIYLSPAQAIPFTFNGWDLEGTPLAQKQFTGTITDISIDTGYGFGPGDISIGSSFDVSYVVYRDHPDYSSDDLILLSLFTFHGASGDYSVLIDAGPDSWGQAQVSPTDSLSVQFNNNFESNGLENSFYNGINAGSDYGYFGFTVADFTKDVFFGSGGFGWEGIDVAFNLNSIPVPEPSTLAFLFAGIFVAARRFLTSRTC